MTISEMHFEFKQLMDKMDSLQNPNLEPEEIDVLLNRAQNDLINYLTRDGLEKTQTNQDLIKNILDNYTTSTFSVTADSKTKSKFVVLPDNYRKAIQEEVRISYVDCKNVLQTPYVEVKPITHAEYNDDRKNPFKQPNTNKVLRLATFKIGSDETYELISSEGVTITNYYLRYYRNPLEMAYATQYPVPGTDVDCELSIEAQREIIKRAVILASKALENIQKYQLEELSKNN